MKTVHLLKKKTLLAGFIMALSLSAMAHSQNISPAEATQKAIAQTGGNVIKVTPFDEEKQGYYVRVLTPNGQVRTLFIPDEDS